MGGCVLALPLHPSVELHLQWITKEMWYWGYVLKIVGANLMLDCVSHFIFKKISEVKKVKGKVIPVL
jgi:hypothetical protein